MHNHPQHHTKDWKLPKLWLWNTVFWVVLWSFSVYNNLQWAISAGAPFSWDMVFSWSLPYYLVMILTGPFVIQLYDRWRRLTPWAQVGRHLLPALVSGLLHQLALNIFYIIFHPVSQADTTRDLMEKFLYRYEVYIFFSANGFLFYCLCVGLLLGIDLFNRSRQQRMDNLAMSAELNKARFQALQNQLQPHFLFNSFNSLAMMARQEKNKEVVDMISRLSNLLRETLKLGDEHRVTITREMELIQLYLDIEQIRFRDRLKIKVEVDPTLKEETLPALLLQPIIENAFHHGIGKVEENATLEISVMKQDEFCLVKIKHSAPPLPSGWHYEDHMGIGLSNVLNRLELSYGKRFTFLMGNDKGGEGIVTQITLPLD